MDKGYLNPDINAYADMIGRKVIIDQRAHMGIAPLPLEKPEAARTTVERTNSELKDGYLPDKIYKRGCHARYDIKLAILLTTLKKVRNVLLAREEARVANRLERTWNALSHARSWLQGWLGHARKPYYHARS